jgi:hypothetical protein
MKKMKFDALVESLLITEGTISKQQRYGNVRFDLGKIIDKIEDSESDDYKSLINPAIERWKGQGYLGNLSSDNIKSILDEITTHFEEMKNDGVDYLKHPDLNSIVDSVTRTRFKGQKEGLSTLASRWSSKLQGLFEKMKDVQDQDTSDLSDSDTGDDSSEDELDIPTETKSSGITATILNMVQGSDSMSRDEISNYLIRKMGRDKDQADRIINDMINNDDLLENEEGRLEVNKTSGEVEAFGVPDDNDEIETGIPFRDNSLEGEDEDVDAAIRSSREDDADFYRSGSRGDSDY